MVKAVKRAVPRSATTAGDAAATEHVSHLLHSLLQTMRVIDTHEERLCVLLTGIKKSGKLTTAGRRELIRLVGEMPGEIYAAELRSVQDALAE